MLFGPFILTNDGPRLGQNVFGMCQLGLSTRIVYGIVVKYGIVE